MPSSSSVLKDEAVGMKGDVDSDHPSSLIPHPSSLHVAAFAIFARAGGKGALYGALGFPILLPLLFIAVRATSLAISGEDSAELPRDVGGLLSFAVMLITVSALLFPFVWEET